MKIHASIPQVAVTETRIVSKGGGYKSQQSVLLHVEGRLAPLESSVILEDGKPFEVGLYEISPDSFYAARFGAQFSLRLGNKIASAKIAAAA